MSVMNSLAFMPCSFSARASVQRFRFPRGLVVCVLVRAAMDVDAVTVMPVAATLVSVVMITPADFIFLAAAVVVYLGGVVTGIW